LRRLEYLSKGAKAEGVVLVTTYHDEQARSGVRSGSRTRWLVIAGLVAAIAVVVALVLLYAGGGGGSGGGGGY